MFGPRVTPGRPSGGDAPVDVRCEYAAASFATGASFLGRRPPPGSLCFSVPETGRLVEREAGKGRDHFFFHQLPPPPHTGGERRKRLRRDRRAAEAASLLRDAVSASILTTSDTRGARLDVGVHVLADGGGALAASLNAAAAALGDAGVPLADLLAACGATSLDGATLLDPSDAEERGDGPTAVVAAWTTRGGLAAVHTDRAAPPDALADLLAAAEDGAAVAGATLREALLAKAAAVGAAAGGF